MAVLNYVDREGVATLWGLMVAELSTKLSANDIATLESAVSTNTAALAVLNGTGEGSVTKAVADGIATIIAGADASLDTLKEVADWIGGHGSDAAKMNSKIVAAQEDVDALETKVGTLPEGETDVVTYVQKLTDSVVSDTALEEIRNNISALQTKSHSHTNMADLNTISATKIAAWDDASTKAHNHSNSTVLNGISDVRVSNWDNAEKNAKDFASGLVNALDTYTALTEEEIKAICVIK